MGPPEDTPHKGYRLKGKDLTIGTLESPLSLDKHNIDTPFNMNIVETPTLSKLMNLIPSSRNMNNLTSDSLKFDFDEIVQHFPSPHNQNYPPLTLTSTRNNNNGNSQGQGSSTFDLPSSTWANLNIDSTTSIGSIHSNIFNFSETVTGLGYPNFGLSSTPSSSTTTTAPTTTTNFNQSVSLSPTANSISKLNYSTPKSLKLSPLSSPALNHDSILTPISNSINSHPPIENYSSSNQLDTPNLNNNNPINTVLFEQGKFGSMKKRRQANTPTIDNEILDSTQQIRNEFEHTSPGPQSNSSS